MPFQLHTSVTAFWEFGFSIMSDMVQVVLFKREYCITWGKNKGY